MASKSRHKLETSPMGDIGDAGLRVPISPEAVRGIIAIQSIYRGERDRDNLFWKDNNGNENDKGSFNEDLSDITAQHSDFQGDDRLPKECHQESNMDAIDMIPNPVPPKRTSLTTHVEPDSIFYAKKRFSLNADDLIIDDASVRGSSTSFDEPVEPSLTTNAPVLLTSADDMDTENTNTQQPNEVVYSNGSSPDDGKSPRRRTSSTDGSSNDVKNQALLEAQVLMQNQKRRESFATGEQATISSAPVPIDTTSSTTASKGTTTQPLGNFGGSIGSTKAEVGGLSPRKRTSSTEAAASSPLNLASNVVLNLASSPAGRSLLETMGAAELGLSIGMASPRVKATQQDEEERQKLIDLQNAMRIKAEHDQELQRLEQQEKQQRELRKEEMMKKRQLRKSATGVDGMGVGTNSSTTQMEISATRQLSAPPVANAEAAAADQPSQHVIHIETEIAGVIPSSDPVAVSLPRASNFEGEEGPKSQEDQAEIAVDATEVTVEEKGEGQDSKQSPMSRLFAEVSTQERKDTRAAHAEEVDTVVAGAVQDSKVLHNPSSPARDHIPPSSTDATSQAESSSDLDAPLQGTGTTKAPSLALPHASSSSERSNPSSKAGSGSPRSPVEKDVAVHSLEPDTHIDSGDELEKQERERLQQAEKERLATIDSLAEVLPESRRMHLKSISSSSPISSRSNSSTALGKLLQQSTAAAHLNSDEADGSNSNISDAA